MADEFTECGQGRYDRSEYGAAQRIRILQFRLCLEWKRRYGGDSGGDREPQEGI